MAIFGKGKGKEKEGGEPKPHMGELLTRRSTGIRPKIKGAQEPIGTDVSDLVKKLQFTPEDVSAAHKPSKTLPEIGDMKWNPGPPDDTPPTSPQLPKKR